MSKSKTTSSSPNNRVKTQYYTRSPGVSSVGGFHKSKKGKAKLGPQTFSAVNSVPDVLPPAPFPHFKGKP